MIGMNTTEREYEVQQWVQNHPRAADESEVAYMARMLEYFQQSRADWYRRASLGAQ
jgi:acyl-CoA thioesterase FadM